MPTAAAATMRYMTDQRIAKWQGWIDGTIKNNVLTMHLQRDAWRKVSKMLQDNGQLPESYWWEFMRDTYATTQAVAVRRQADTHKDVASLGKLIEEVTEDPSGSRASSGSACGRSTSRSGAWRQSARGRRSTRGAWGAT